MDVLAANDLVCLRIVADGRGDPYPASDMTMKLASVYVNKAGNEGPDCLAAAN
jgi:hypothetical protein